MQIATYIDQEGAYLTALRRHFHKYPEVSTKEYHTAEKIEEELESMGISHHRSGETGVVATLVGKGIRQQQYEKQQYEKQQGEKQQDEKQLKKLVLRADIDALPIQEKNETEYCSVNPGVMHACGHDAHIAALLGAAKALQQGIDAWAGEVTLLFQPAEEIGAGARAMIDDGLIAQADRIFGVHMASYLPTGTISVKHGECNASCDYFKITVTGKSAHVSRPQEGIDSLYIASQIVVALQAVAARMTNPLEPVVVGIGKMTAGSNYNIIAKEAVLEGTTRAFNEHTRKRINELIVSIAKNTALTYGAEADVTFVDYASPLINDEDANQETAEAAAGIAEVDHIVRDGDRYMAADDFAEYLKQVKGQYVFVGSGNGTTTSYPHHHELFDVEEKAVLIAAKLYVSYVERILGTDKRG